MRISSIKSAVCIALTITIAGSNGRLVIAESGSTDPNSNVAEVKVGWSEFHGPAGTGFVSEGSLPKNWTDQEYVWRYPLAASDVGSPVIAGGIIYFLTTDREAKTISLEAVQLATGSPVFKKSFPQSAFHVHSRNSFASSTPAVDDKGIVVAWSDSEHTFLKSFDIDGNEQWSRDFGTWQSQHGFGTSPRLFGSMVLLFNSQQADQLRPGEEPGQSRMIAVSRDTGETLWETPLETTRTCYGVPAIFVAPDGTTQIIAANTGNGMFGLDSQDGRMLWNLPVFSKRCCSTPVLYGNLALASTGSGGGGNELVAVRIPTSDAEKPEEVYRIDRSAPYVPTLAVKGNQFFMVDDKGIASCREIETGTPVWTKRLGGNYSASPIIVGDTLLAINLDGIATLMGTGDKFEPLGKVDLGGSVGATPAFSDGYLVLRVGDEIRCLSNRSESE
ncbi:PQQ-binding-like beta-propeller repeat protein [Novipirellula herctigrandis]|uniref:outer membrane protein assembly factor BamB family protein n=1 Tax=Novipirellula herctigrandis TaxID=2527986 RepID=UPI003AF3B87F